MGRFMPRGAKIMPKAVFIRAILCSPHILRFLPFSWHVSQPLLAYGGRRHLLQAPWWWNTLLLMSRDGVTCIASRWVRAHVSVEVMGYFHDGSRALFLRLFSQNFMALWPS